MQNKKVLQLVISAVMAFLFVNFYLKNKEGAIEHSFGMVEVLTAAQDIPPRTQLTPNYLTSQQVPRKFMQPDAILVKIPAEAYKRVQGKVTLAPVPAGSQLTQSLLVDPAMKDTGIAPLIPPGKRGYLLRLGNMDVAQLILPGDKIDVMATFTVRKNEGNAKATYTILQNILVISVGKELRPSNADVKGKTKDVEGLNVTLALSPTEAERLALAQSESQGEITITVRPPGEADTRPLPGSTPNNLVGR